MITEATHATYSAKRRDWVLVRRMLTGENAKLELNERFFEEHPSHFKQRKRDADHTPLTRRHVSRVVGMLFQRYDDVSRDSGPVEGLDSIGPEGESYLVQLLQLAETLLAYDKAYLVYKPNAGLDVVGPLSVPVWNATEKVVKGSRVPQGQSVFSDVQEVETYTRYTPRGYEVYRQTEDDGDKKDDLIEEGRWAVNEDGESDAHFVDENDGAPTPPVLKVEMPWDASFGEQIAKKHRAIFELRSRRDFAASTSMNGLLQVGVGKSEGDDDLAQQIKDAIENSRILPYRTDYGEHKGVSYPVEGIEMGTKIIAEKEQELQRVAYKVLDEATRKTATEAAIQHSEGAASALSVLASKIEDAEESVLKIIAQAQDMRLAGPNPRSISVDVDWPKDYSGIADGRALIDRIFPSGIPVDAETATTIVVDHLREHGYSEEEVERSQIKEQIEDKQAADAQGSSVSSFNVGSN